MRTSLPVYASVRPLLLLLVLSPACLWAQQSDQSQQPNPTQTQGADQDQEQLPTFHSNVDVVNLFFNVKDKKGNLIPTLKKEDFEVVEDGKPQTIKYFAADTNQPLTLGILIDTSASQERVLPMEQEVGAAFLREVLTPKDMAFVINFDIAVELDQDFTASARDLQKALNSVRINAGGPPATGIPGVGGGPIPQHGTPKGTLLYDAIFLGADEKLKQEVGRKAMIILTDGEDQGSMMTLKRAVEAAQKSDTIVYVLLIADRGFYYGQLGYSGDRDMKRLTDETGGRVIEVGNKFEKLKAAFDQIAAELRTQYSIGYTPTNTAHDGSYRKIEIHANGKDYRVQTRRGYYAPTR
jgi:VWFA-related protein